MINLRDTQILLGNAELELARLDAEMALLAKYKTAINEYVEYLKLTARKIQEYYRKMEDGCTVEVAMAGMDVLNEMLNASELTMQNLEVQVKCSEGGTVP